jgi:hypothetical protein
MIHEDEDWDGQSVPTTPVDETAIATAEAAPEKYRAVNGYAVASLVLGVLSLLTLVYWALAVVPLAGIALAWLAFRRFRRNPEEQTGLVFAKLGLGLSIGLWAFGYGYQLYLYVTAAPPGYMPISYKTLQPDPGIEDERVPPAAEDLDKRKVFIRGYMFRASQRTNIREFVLIDDPGACNFCAPKPKPTQLILIKLEGNLRTEYTTHMIGVGGVFTVHQGTKDDDKEKGKDKEMRGLVYKIEADCLR